MKRNNVEKNGKDKNRNGMLLKVRDLEVAFSSRKGGKKAVVRAVNGVSFDVRKGETLGLVGESGCGKTTLGRALLRLTPVPVKGGIWYDGKAIETISNRDFRSLRSEIQMIFQDPFSSLNPRMMIGQMLNEAEIDIPAAVKDHLCSKILLIEFTARFNIVCTKTC